MAKQTIAAFNGNANSTSLTAINPISDAGFFVTSGANLTVPTDLPFVAGAYLAGTNLARARLDTSFLLKSRVYAHATEVDTGAQPANLSPAQDWKLAPLQIIDPGAKTLDNLNVRVAQSTAATGNQVAAVMLSDGPVGKGSLAGTIPVRFTGTYTPSATYTWGTHTIAFDETLAPGVYEMEFLRYVGATTIAGRVVGAPGQLNQHLGNYRPGFIAVNGVTQQLPIGFGPGDYSLGVRFRSDQLPSIETICASTAAQAPSGTAWLRKIG